MVDALILPDVEAISSFAIRIASIPGLIGVYSSIPAKNPRYPLATVKRLGGAPANKHRLDMARIQVDVWGGAPKDGPGAPSKSDIQDIAQLARVELLMMEGKEFTVPVRAFVTAVRDSMGITWSPDPTTGRDRYIFAMNVYASPPKAGE